MPGFLMAAPISAYYLATVNRNFLLLFSPTSLNMGTTKNSKSQRLLLQLLQKIDRDGRDAGLNALAIQQLKKDCEKILLLNGSQFQI